MTRINLALTLLAVTCIGCADTKFKNPMVRAELAPVCGELFGVYKSTEPGSDNVSYLHIGSAGKDFPAGFMRIAIVNHNNNKKRSVESSTIVAFAQPVGDYFVGQLPMPDQKNLSSQLEAFENKWDETKAQVYFFFLLKRTDNGLEIRYLNSPKIEERIRAGTLSGIVNSAADPSEADQTPKDASSTVTATTEELAALFTEDALDDLFADEIVRYDSID